MNALFLAATAAIAFFFGYRFFAKLLALGIFGLPTNYSTASAAAEVRAAVTNRHLLLIHHAMILTSGVTVAGSIMALTWGWIPALLWIVIGATVGGGTLNLGALWLAGRRGGVSLFKLSAALGGRLVGVATVGAATVSLTLLAALCAVIAGRLLVAQPSAVLPVLLVAAAAWILGRAIASRSGLDVLPITVIALIGALGLMWFAAKLPVSISGALNLDLLGASQFSITALVAWILLTVVFGIVASRARADRFAFPYALLQALLLAVVLLLVLVGLLVERPAMVTPEFHTPAAGPGPLPWLFVVLSSGAVAGIAFVAAVGSTAARMPRPADARYIGYGAALIEGAIALAAIVLGGVAFTDVEPWKQSLGQWPALLDVGNATAIFLDGFARLAGTLDIDATFARTFAATVLIGLCLTTLEFSTRMLVTLSAEATRPLALAPTTDAPLRRAVVMITIVLVALAAGARGAGLLLAYGGASLLLATMAFTLVAAGLRAAAGPVLVAAVPMLVIAGLVLWVVIDVMLGWWHADRWGLLIAGALALAAFGAFLLAAARVFRLTPGSPT